MKSSPQKQFIKQQVHRLESHACLKFTYVPVWRILHERIVDDLYFPYCFHVIILNFLMCIICVIKQVCFSIIVTFYLDPQELLERQYAPERGLINQEQSHRLPRVLPRQKTTFKNLKGMSEINCLALNEQNAGGITGSEGLLRNSKPQVGRATGPLRTLLLKQIFGPLQLGNKSSRLHVQFRNYTVKVTWGLFVVCFCREKLANI